MVTDTGCILSKKSALPHARRYWEAMSRKYITSSKKKKKSNKYWYLLYIRCRHGMQFEIPVLPKLTKILPSLMLWDRDSN